VIEEYSWPGNVRELENAIERAVILCDSSVITADMLAVDTYGHGDSPTVVTPVGTNHSLDDYMRNFVLEHQGALTETELARRLGISRKTLWEKRQRLEIPRKRKAKTASSGGPISSAP
jgi:DNA-binding NtrC family response regulator